MKVSVHKSLLELDLYRDLDILARNIELNGLPTTPRIEDYYISYIEKLMDFVDEDYDSETRYYIINEFLSFKGTLKIFQLMEKYLKIEVTNYSWNNEELIMSLSMAFTGNDFVLLNTLIKDFISFLLLFSKMDMLYNKLIQILEVNNNSRTQWNLIYYENVVLIPYT